MPKQDNEYPNYYDGSVNVEFSEEFTKILQAKQDEEPGSSEEWRHFISTNPFGI